MKRQMIWGKAAMRKAPRLEMLEDVLHVVLLALLNKNRYLLL